MKNFRLQLSIIFALACGLALRAQTTPLSGGTGVATDATITFTDITTNNSSTSKHGFLPKLSGSASDVLKGDGTFGAVSGTGTVTHTLGALTLNALVLGNAAADTQTVAGFTTDGVSILTLGVAGSSVGTVAFKNATSGTTSLLPPTGALGTFNVTLPNAASTLPIYGAQMTYTGPSAPRTITYPDASFTVARTDAANTFTGVQSMTSPAITTSLTSPSATFALLNVTPTTINAFGNATTINMGNASGTTNLLGTLALNPSGTVAGNFQMGQGTLPALGTTAATWSGPASITSHNVVVPGSVGSTGLMQWSVSGTTATISPVTALPSNFTASTKAIGDATTSVATDGFVNNAALSPPTVDATTTHALVLADGFPGSNYITMTSASANTVNIPLNATQAFPVGTTIYVKQGGTGATSITTTGGVTPNSNGGLLTVPGQNSVVALIKNATDTWDIYGTGPIVTYPATTAINTLLYSSAANTISATAATINNAVIITGAGGIPGPSTTLPSGLTIPAPIFSTGATASGSGNFDLSGSSGTFITSTGAATIGPGAVGITGALTITGPAATTALTLTQTARTSGILPYIKYTIPTDTTLTVATEAPGIQGITGTRQWATGGGTLALQREIFFPGPTYSAAAAMTITDGFNMYLTPPVPGTNMTVTRNHTLGIVDSTAANSSTTGAFVVANTLGTASSSVSIGNGQVNAGGTVAVGGNLVVSGKNTNYSNVTTAGWGLPAIYAAGRSTAQTGAVASVSTYTCGASDGSFEVSANVLVTTSTTHAFTCTCTYTDEGNTARTLTFTFSNVGGTLLTSIANTGGAAPYEGIPLHIRAKASTAITIGTTGTFTSVTYNVEGVIKQLL